MAHTTYKTAATLDGFIADGRNSLQWLFDVDQSSGCPDHDTFMASVGVIVEGSTTYEWVLRHERLLAEPDKWPRLFGDRPTFVFTSRDLPVPDGADVRFVRGPVQAVRPAIEEADAGLQVWVVGGGDLAGQFADIGALDRLIVTIAPATLGGGAPLLPRRIESDRLSLLAAEQCGQFAELTYAVAPPAE